MINFSTKENLSRLINIEKISLNSYLTIQKSLNKQILSFLKSFVSDIKIDLEYDSDNILFSLLNEASSNLKKNNENIKKLEKLLKKLDKLNDKSISKLKVSELREIINEYNKNFESSIESIFKNSNTIEKFILKISTLNLNEIFIEVSKKSSKNTVNNNSSISLYDDISTENILENTLIISETEKKVLLPYTIEEIKNILLDDNNPYHSIKDVIDNIYTIPLKKYSPSAFARFREAYNLITKKEKQSKLKALSLANELFFNFNLQPAIISACKSLDELDIYLACLEDNCLDDFKYFDIKFEVPPTVVANSKIANRVEDNS